jgi:hypothetical protein
MARGSPRSSPGTATTSARARISNLASAGVRGATGLHAAGGGRPDPVRVSGNGSWQAGLEAGPAALEELEREVLRDRVVSARRSAPRRTRRSGGDGGSTR